jgi:hypothetical protein
MSQHMLSIRGLSALDIFNIFWYKNLHMIRSYQITCCNKWLWKGLSQLKQNSDVTSIMLSHEDVIGDMNREHQWREC